MNLSKMLQAGLILPLSLDWESELSYYQECLAFKSEKLENRRKLCPDLFRIGSNIINHRQAYPLNITLTPVLSTEFPGTSFVTPNDFEKFSQTETWYWAEHIPDDSGEDLLGNNYSQLVNVLIRIVPGSPLGDYSFRSTEELTACFLYKKRFVDPYMIQIELDIVDLKRLKKLFTERRLTLQLQLIETLNHENFDPPTVSKEFLEELLKIGLLMRGWDEKGAFPLRTDTTFNPVFETELIERMLGLLSVNSIELNLPIFCYDFELKRFCISVDPSQGYTIKDRLNIILKNEDSYACIRVGSNWIVSTAWYYLKKYFQIEPYPIQELELIQ